MCSPKKRLTLVIEDVYLTHRLTGGAGHHGGGKSNAFHPFLDGNGRVVRGWST
jgi:fido (protein-threonine AMPylation protein)